MAKRDLAQIMKYCGDEPVFYVFGIKPNTHCWDLGVRE
jgi:hypothetical protein